MIEAAAGGPGKTLRSRLGNVNWEENADVLDAHIPPQTRADNPLPYRSTYFPRLTMRDLALRICEREGFSMEELRGDYRVKRIAIPRQEFMWLARQTRQWTYPQIARWLHKDHCTVWRGCRSHERRLSTALSLPVDNRPLSG